MALGQFVFLILAFTTVAAGEQAAANPIRKVVSMLQAMQKKISAEADTEAELYSKFECYCKDGGRSLGDTISSAETKVPALGSDIEQAESKGEQLKQALKQHQVDRADAKAAMEAAKQLRAKDASAYAAEKAEQDTNIASVKAAVAAIEKGMSSSFVQTEASQSLQKLVLVRQDMLEADREQVIAFLSGTQSSALPQSGEIVGILKEMGSNMEKGLAAATDAEKAAITTYDELMAAQKKQVDSSTAGIEVKSQRIGELAVSVVQMKNDLTDTEQALIDDKKYVAELEKTCSTKASEWEERKKTRSEELVALADTIRLLNDDDALDLFKKTLPSASSSFVQMQSTDASTRVKALSTILELRKAHGSPNLDFLVLALRGKKNGFEKVISMIDAMVNTLKKEQQGDEHKVEYCTAQLDQAAGKIKDLDRSVSDADAAISDAEGGLSATKEAIATLEAGIEALDKSVAEANEQRVEEHAEFNQLVTSDSAAVELLNMAKNRMNKFYNKNLFKAAPKRELSEADRIVVNNGGTAPPTAAPGGIAGTGITAFAEISEHSQSMDAPAPPPETFDAYSKKSGEANGVIAMIDLLIKDVEKELTEAKTDEKDSQADYEAMLKESATKRAGDAKALSEKATAKAELEGDVQRHGEAKTAASKELMATSEYQASLHAECDWIVSNADVRKGARNNEIDSLQNAKAILSGADYSL